VAKRLTSLRHAPMPRSGRRLHRRSRSRRRASSPSSQPTAETAHEAVSHALQLLEPRFAKAAALLQGAEADVLAYMAFPADH